MFPREWTGVSPRALRGTPQLRETPLEKVHRGLGGSPATTTLGGGVKCATEQAGRPRLPSAYRAASTAEAARRSGRGGVSGRPGSPPPVSRLSYCECAGIVVCGRGSAVRLRRRRRRGCVLAVEPRGQSNSTSSAITPAFRGAARGKVRWSGAFRRGGISPRSAEPAARRRLKRGAKAVQPPRFGLGEVGVVVGVRTEAMLSPARPLRIVGEG